VNDTAIRKAPETRAAAGSVGTREEVVATHAGLVRAIARQWTWGLPPMLEEADLVQEGFLALIHCAAVFDPARGAPFSTYAWRSVTRAVREARVRAERGLPRRWRRPPDDEEEHAGVADPAEAPCPRAPTAAEMARNLAIRQMLDQLPPSTRTILRWHFGFGGVPRSYGRIARDLKQPRESVRAVARRGLSTLAAAWREKEE
jgi:RNA polymerase sigma factor (sigma-70 family)